MCSDDCWVASRGRQLTWGQQLGRTVQAMQASHERRVIGRARVDAMLRDAELDGTVKRYQAEVKETLGLISRLRDRADPGRMYRPRGSAQERRQLAEIARSGGHADDCADCRSLAARSGATPREAAIIHAEITHTCDADGMGRLGDVFGRVIAR
jgi:hypothetical protein